MAVERTLSIIKPDATRRNLTGKIIAKFEDAGLRVVASAASVCPRPRPKPSTTSIASGPSSAAWSNS